MSSKNAPQKPLEHDPQPGRVGDTDGGFWRSISLNEWVSAILIGLVVFLRPWNDGITYPDRNAYFLFVILAACVFWAVRPAIGRISFRSCVPVSMLLGYLAIAGVATWYSVQYGASYRSFMIWSGHVLLFALMANGFRTRQTLALVLVFFAVTSLAETLFSFMHVKWIMPATREQIMTNPMLLRQYFRSDVLTPDIQHRLESNRATGTLLFANALGAWLILGIPFALGIIGYSFARLKSRMRSGVEVNPADPESRVPLLAALFAFCGVFVAISVHYTFYFYYAYPGDTWTHHLVRWTVYCFVIPLVSSIGAFWFTRRYGGYACWLLFAAIFCAFIVVFQTIALGLTYSRGAMLGLAAAMLLGALLLWRRGRGLPVLDRRWPAWAGAAILLIVVLAMTAQPWAHAQDAPPAKPDAALETSGRNVALDDLMNPATAFLRLSYWAAGVKMARDYFFTGVGPGNFGSMYPRYQLIGGGEVKQAHNDYLQIWCETGVFGAAAFVAFWIYFVVWGSRRIASEADSGDRWMLTGLFCSVVAFLLHAAVDFNFANPSLATPGFLLAGAFFGFAAKPGRSPAGEVTGARSRIFGASVLILAVVLALGQFRVSRQSMLIGDEGERYRRFDAARVCLDWAEDPQTNAAPMKNILMDSMVASFFPERAVREQFGVIWVPVGQGTTKGRVLQPEESLEPFAAVAFLQVRDFKELGEKAHQQIGYWLEQSKQADALFPHDLELGVHIYLWHELLYSKTSDPEKQRFYADMCVYWAEICESRCPRQSAYQELVGRALWRRGRIASGDEATRYFENALQHYKMAAEYYPVRPEVWDEYNVRCVALGDRYQSLGLAEKAEATRAEGRRAKDFANSLREAWAKTKPLS
ncbi:MAG: hypothetical protein AMXMBFR84_47940 [Candidatus Hydrogenedentota bacterium]